MIKLSRRGTRAAGETSRALADDVRTVNVSDPFQRDASGDEEAFCATLTGRDNQRCIVPGNTVLGNRLDGCDMNFGCSSTDSNDLTGNAFSSSGFDVLPVSGGRSITLKAHTSRNCRESL